MNNQTELNAKVTPVQLFNCIFQLLQLNPEHLIRAATPIHCWPFIYNKDLV